MKEGKVFKRILAIALVVVMTITMVPFGVFAGTGDAPACTHSDLTKIQSVSKVQPTCTTTGKKAHYICKACNTIVMGNATDGYTTYTYDLTIAKVAHTYSTLVAAKEATCVAAGNVAHYTCSKCTTIFDSNKNVIATAVIPVNDNHNLVDVVAKDATCTENGYTAHKKCNRVGCTYTVGKTDVQAAHKWATTFTVDTPATCKAAGSKSIHCTVTNCTGKKDITAINALPHTFDKSKADGKCTVAGCTGTCAHTYVKTEVAATCTAKGADLFTCSTCGHSYKVEKGNLAAHTAVDIPEVAATCTTAGSKGGQKCSVCGEVLHAAQVVNALGHKIEKIASVAATCTTAGKTEGEKCTRDGCTYVKAQEPIAARGHAWSTEKKVTLEATCTAKGSKATVCTREGCNTIKEGTIEEIAMKPHDYKAKAVTKEATCETAGEKAKVCKNCTAKIEIEAIPALGHDWDNGTVKVPADCTKDGVTTYKCKRTGCGKTEDRKVDKLEHEYKEEKVEATCEKDGYSVFTCQCGDEYIAKKVEKFGHSFITYVQDANTATCYADGTKTAECDHGCGKKNTIPDEGSKIDHKMTDFTTIKPATCTEEGEEEGKCFYFDKCGYSESYPTDALGHTVTKDTQFTVDKPATCTEKGSQSKHCERCDYTEGTEEIPALGHDYQPGAGTDATCTTGGHIKYVCTRCSDSYDVDNAEPLGHDFQYVSNNNATCKEDGTETGKCSRCDVVDTRTEVGSKLPHTLGEAVVVPASTEENGSITTKCTVCDEVVEAVEIAKIAKLSLKYKVATYDGKTKHPKLTITDANGNVLVKGTDYTVEIPTKEESAKAGKHTYTVTFMGNYEGEEEVSYKVVPGKTSKISSEKKQTEIKLSWKAVKGATGYRVYVYNTKTKKYNIVAKYVKGKTSYTVKDLKANTSYKFAVKAYTKVDGELFWAEESTKVTVKTLVGKTSKITAAPAATSVKLSWKKVSGADGYRVYVYNAKTKSYKILEKNVTGTSYTVKGLKAGTSYKFAVKAYDTVSKKTVWSNQYTTVNVTTKR